MSTLLLKVHNLSKIYPLSARERKSLSTNQVKSGGLLALSKLNFELKAGEILGLIGGNGAGKTTTLRILSTAITPSEGHIEILSRNDLPFIRKNTGFLSNTTGLHPKLTPRELISFYGELYGVQKKEIKKKTEHIAKVLNLSEYLDLHCEKLSFGNRQKVSFARSIIHDPQLMILDEPTTGLDVLACAEVINMIKEFQSNDKGIIFSSHNMEDIQQICDRILLLHKGFEIYQGSTEGLLEQTKTLNLREAVHVLTQGDSDA